MVGCLWFGDGVFKSTVACYFPFRLRNSQHGAVKGHILSVLFKRLLKRVIEASVELKPGKQLRILWDEDSKVRGEWKQLLGHVLFFFSISTVSHLF